MNKVFTKHSCAQCQMTKTVLDENEVPYETYNVEEDSESFDYVVNTLGFQQMPVVVPENGEPFSGFRPDKLEGMS